MSDIPSNASQNATVANPPGPLDKVGRRRRIIRIVIATLVIAGLVIGAAYYIYAGTHVSSDDAFIEGHVVFVAPRVSGHVQAVTVNDNQWVEAGTTIVELDPRDYQARCDAAGAAYLIAKARLLAANVTLEITRVTATAALDVAGSAYQQSHEAVATAEAQVGTTDGMLQQARIDVNVQQSLKDQAQAAIASAEAQHTRDELDLQRYKDMYGTDSATKQQLDNATAAANVSAANLEAARKAFLAAEARVAQSNAAVTTADQKLRQTKSMLEETRTAVAQAKARLDSAQSAPQQIAFAQSQVELADAQAREALADLKQAQLNLSYTRIGAPMAGYVTRRTVEPGNFVQTGQAMLALVTADMWVVANFKETQLTDMKPGQAVQIKVDAYPGKTFTGRLDSIQWGTGARFSLLPPENATGNYIKVVQRVPVKIVFDTSPDLKDYHLAPGMSVVPVVNLSSALAPAPPSGAMSAWMPASAPATAQSSRPSTSPDRQEP